MSSVLRLGVYRERIEKYGSSSTSGSSNRQSMRRKKQRQVSKGDGSEGKENEEEDLFSQLGLRLSGNCSENGIFIVDIQKGSIMSNDDRLRIHDRLLYINGTDVRTAGIATASALIQ
ncbi:Uncharacterized protein FKW44_022656, partial [Caligus rogercresseyi]